MSNDLPLLSPERMFGDLPRKGDPTPDIKHMAEECTAFNIAYALAKAVHEGQMKKDQIPYMSHIDAVIKRVWENEYTGPFDLLKGSLFWLKLIVAALHDAYEDHPEKCSIEVIKDLLLPHLGEEQLNYVVKAVIHISKNQEKNPRTYDQYIMDILYDNFARPVKIADLQDNMVSYGIKDSILAKYELSLAILQMKFTIIPTNHGS